MNFSLIYLLCFMIIECIKLKQEPITVHVVPHTHDDAGWLNTFQEYFDGKGDLNISVSKILDNMVESLNERADRTFIYVEIAFFEKWYTNVTEEIKEQVKEFVKEGRLEFINGGYVMHDEATAYYQDMIDQMRLGLLFLKNEFNVIPNVGWYIDPFGHSAANAHILAKMGYENIVLSRIDYKEKAIRKLNKTMEFVWKPFSQVDNSNTEIFTHIQYDGYCMPGDFGYLIEDKEINKTESEFAELAEKFYDTLKNISKTYNHNQVLLTYGCDFTFRNKSFNFRNIERIMTYYEKNIQFNDIRLIYSTPSTYFKVIKEVQSKWPVYENQDFFPYAENPYSYWTGYFSSRPYLKGMVRDAGNFLSSSSNLLVELIIKNKIDKAVNIHQSKLDDILNLRQNLAICQHHDAVSGTAKEYVSDNYIDILTTSIERVRLTLSNTLNEIVDFPAQDITNCISPISNTNCQNLVFKQNAKLNVMLIFANNRVGKFPLSFKTQNGNLKLNNEAMQSIDSDVICGEDQSSNLCSIYFDLIFSSNQLFNVVLIEKTNFPRRIEPLKRMPKLFDVSKSDQFRVIFNEGNLSIYLPEYNQIYNITLSHSTYLGKNENQTSIIRPSDANPDGSYVFAPFSSHPDKDHLDLNKTLYWNGTTLKQLSLRFTNSTMVLRFYRSFDYAIEIESIFDPIMNCTKNQVKNGSNSVLHLESNLDNLVVLKNITLNGKNISLSQPEFWTDSNGMKMMRRYKDFRGGWKYYITDPISSNFYPVNHAISIREKVDFDYNKNDYHGAREDDPVITIFTERSQSGGAMKKGEIMLLMNRYSKSDDWKGLGENLYEKKSLDSYFRMKNIISFSNYFDNKQIYDYIHSRPTTFSFNMNTTFTNNFLLKEHILENFLYNSSISDILSHDECIVVSYHIISSKKILVQAYNNNDPYFAKNKACKINFKSSIYVPYTFEEISVSGTHNLDLIKEFRSLKRNLGQGQTLLKNEYSIDPQDIKLFSLDFIN